MGSHFPLFFPHVGEQHLRKTAQYDRGTAIYLHAMIKTAGHSELVLHLCF
jgi:hypothetical protein